MTCSGPLKRICFTWDISLCSLITFFTGIRIWRWHWQPGREVFGVSWSFKIQPIRCLWILSNLCLLLRRKGCPRDWLILWTKLLFLTLACMRLRVKGCLVISLKMSILLKPIISCFCKRRVNCNWRINILVSNLNNHNNTIKT